MTVISNESCEREPEQHLHVMLYQNVKWAAGVDYTPLRWFVYILLAILFSILAYLTIKIIQKIIQKIKQICKFFYCVWSIISSVWEYII